MAPKNRHRQKALKGFRENEVPSTSDDSQKVRTQELQEAIKKETQGLEEALKKKKELEEAIKKVEEQRREREREREKKKRMLEHQKKRRKVCLTDARWKVARMLKKKPVCNETWRSYFDGVSLDDKKHMLSTLSDEACTILKNEDLVEKLPAPKRRNAYDLGDIAIAVVFAPEQRNAWLEIFSFAYEQEAHDVGCWRISYKK